MNRYPRSNPLDTLLGLVVIAGGILTVLTAVAWVWETYQLLTSNQLARDVALYGRIASIVIVLFGLVAIRFRSAGYAAIVAFAFSWIALQFGDAPASEFWGFAGFLPVLAVYPWLAIRFPEPAERRERELASNPVQEQGGSQLPHLPITKPRKDLSSLVGMEELKGRLRLATEDILDKRGDGGYGDAGGDGQSGAALISLKSTLSVFAGKEGYRLTWSDSLGDSKISVPPIDRLPGIEAKAAEIAKAGTGSFNLAVDKEAKSLYASADLNGLVQVAGKAGIETLAESNGSLTVKLRSTPKTMYVFDRVDKSDLSVDWQDPTSFTVPMRDKIELALDSKTLQLTRVADKRYVIVLQPSAETTTK